MGLANIFKQAAAIGFKIAGDTKKEVIVKTGPDHAYAVADDRTTTTWTNETRVMALLYEHKESKEDADPEKMKRACLLHGADFAGIEITQEAEVQAEGFNWKVEAVKPDPVGATIELVLYR